ncbi:hypothetical protein ACFLXC_01980 [Chloroflexota bacterium]
MNRMYKCPECHKIACKTKPTKLPGYDPRQRLFVCGKCAHKFYKSIEPETDSEEQMSMILDS